MGLGTFFTNVLPDLKFPQSRDQPRAQQQADQQRRQTGIRGAEGDVLKHVQDPERGPEMIQRI